MKFTLKLFLVVCLFSSVAFADGEMSGGGFADGEMSGGGKIAGEMGSGGLTDGDMTGGLTANDQNQTDSILIFVQKYLLSIFG